MSDPTDFRLDVQIELGVLFGKVHASFPFGLRDGFASIVGAHVTIDGTREDLVIEESDHGLRLIPAPTLDADEIDQRLWAVRHLRVAAFAAIRSVAVAIGLDGQQAVEANQAAIIRALPAIVVDWNAEGVAV